MLFQRVEITRVKLNITNNSVKLTDRNSKELTALREVATRSIENQFGIKINIPEQRKLGESWEEISEKTDEDLTKDTQFDE